MTLTYDDINRVAKRRAAAALFDTALDETRRANPTLNESEVFDATMRTNKRAQTWWSQLKDRPDPSATIPANIVTKAAVEREPDEPDDDADERHAAGKEFKQMVDHVQRMYGCTRVEAQDAVLRSPEGAAAWRRFRAA